MKNPNQHTFSIERPDHTTTKDAEIALIDKLFEVFNGTQSYLDTFFSSDLCVWLKSQIQSDFSTDLYQDFLSLGEEMANSEKTYEARIAGQDKAVALWKSQQDQLVRDLNAAREDALRLATADNQKRLEIQRLQQECDNKDADYQQLKRSSLEEIYTLEDKIVHLKAQLWDTLTVQVEGEPR
jgi:hypothetical protein